MERLDARAASFFAIGLLVLSFGCKAGSAFKAIGQGAATAAKVAVAAGAVAAVANGNGGRVRGGGGGERVEVVEDASDDCRHMCPVMADGRRVFVCARPEGAVDAETGEYRQIYTCPDSTFVAHR